MPVTSDDILDFLQLSPKAFARALAKLEFTAEEKAVYLVKKFRGPGPVPTKLTILRSINDELKPLQVGGGDEGQGGTRVVINVHKDLKCSTST